MIINKEELEQLKKECLEKIIKPVTINGKEVFLFWNGRILEATEHKNKCCASCEEIPRQGIVVDGDFLCQACVSIRFRT